MAPLGRPVVYLSSEQICEINREMISAFGGSYYEADSNLLHPSSLDYITEAISAVMFGEEMYPTLEAKAAALATTIVKRHVFHDGCKRTGVEAARLFLDVNGLTVRLPEETTDVAVRLAECSLDEDRFRLFLIENLTRSAEAPPART